MAIAIYHFFQTSPEMRHRYFANETEAIAVAGSRFRLQTYYGDEEVMALRASLCATLQMSLEGLRPRRAAEFDELNEAIEQAKELSKKRALDSFIVAAHTWHKLPDENATTMDAATFRANWKLAQQEGLSPEELLGISKEVHAQYVK